MKIYKSEIISQEKRQQLEAKKTYASVIESLNKVTDEFKNYNKRLELLEGKYSDKAQNYNKQGNMKGSK